MFRSLSDRRLFLQGLGAAGAALAGRTLLAEEPSEELREPVFRVAKANAANDGATGPHPLDPALELAQKSLEHIRDEVRDYTCTVIKRERVKGQLGDYEYMFAKIRNRKAENGRVTVPFGVYLKFLKPASVLDREVLWVEGQNNGKMRAHEGGPARRFTPTVSLDPTGALAMRGNLYPVTEIGIENLVVKLIEKGTRDKKLGPCEVEFKKGAKINSRVCTIINVKHEKPNAGFDFHHAQVFLDDELNVPIRYVAYGWPGKDGAKQLLEEYTYIDLKINPNLTDMDFNEKNPDYAF